MIKKMRLQCSENCREIIIIGLIVFLTVLFFYPVVFQGRVLLPLDMLRGDEPWFSERTDNAIKPLWNADISDVVHAFYPISVATERAYRNGIPFWDPQMLGGTPGIARGYTIANPIFLFFVSFLPVAQAMSWTDIFAVMIAGIFTFLLLREMGIGRFGALIGALAFAFNGYLIGWLSWTVIPTSMAWFPVIVWSIERSIRCQDWRWLIPGSVAFAFQILSGFILLSFYSAITLILLETARSVILWFRQKRLWQAAYPTLSAGLVLALGAALAAPVLLSTIELFFYTSRRQAVGAHSYLPFTHLWRLLAPHIHGTPFRGNIYHGPYNYTETDLYFGVIPLLLIVVSIFSRRRRLVFVFGLIGLVTMLAVYVNFPFRLIVKVLYPVFLSTFPGRIFFVVAFCWAILAAIGADSLVQERSGRMLAGLRWGLAGLAFVLLSVGGLVRMSHQTNPTPWVLQVAAALGLQNSNSKSVWIAAAIVVCALCIVVLFEYRKISPFMFGVLMTVLVIGDLFWVGMRQNPVFDASLVYPETQSVKVLKEHITAQEEPYRMLAVPTYRILTAMMPQVFDLATVTGYDSWLLQRYALYADITNLRAKALDLQVYYTDCCTALQNALGVKYVYSASGNYPGSSGILGLLSRFYLASKQGRVDQMGVSYRQIDNVTTPVLYQPPTSQLIYQLKISEPATFRSEVRLDPESTTAVKFEVYVVPTGKQIDQLVPVFSAVLDPLSAALPVPIEVDLELYEGQAVDLVLVTAANIADDEPPVGAVWVDPRIDGYFPKTLELIYDGPNRIYENIKVMKRSWIVHRLIQVDTDDTETAKWRLLAPNFDPRYEAIVEVSNFDQRIIKLSPQKSYLGDQVDFVHYSANRVEIDAVSEYAGFLVLSDTMYPGWKAYVDGVQQPIYYTNLFMRGIFLEAGSHRVEFDYEPRPFYLGLAFTVAAMILILATLIVYPRFAYRRKDSNPH